ncbi:MAG: hypothetical protein J5I98_11165 [Phaeodactylibacter sp.]|nr:hypothetical protein [Phaeodactylibacter sp.]
MNAIYSHQRVQRFEFRDDPIACGPPQILNWVDWLPGGMKWGRTGIRNWFSKETNDGYHYAMQERKAHEDIEFFRATGALIGGLGGLCYHHPTWVTRGLFSLIPPDMQNQLPSPPCVAGNKYFRVAPGCSSSDGCRFELHNSISNASEWQLIKIE